MALKNLASWNVQMAPAACGAACGASDKPAEEKKSAACGAACGASDTKALDLVGPRNLKDTLLAVEKGGIVCNTGILGGVYALNNFDPIKDIPNGVYLTGFFSNYPTQETVDALFAFLNEKHIVPEYGAKFTLDTIREACMAQDKGVDGKIVAFAKLRGRKRSIEALAEKYETLAVAPETQTVGVVNAACREDAERLIALLKRKFPPKEIISVDYEPVTGCHVGPGALALFFEGPDDVRTAVDGESVTERIGGLIHSVRERVQGRD
jgi:ACGX-repeat protein